MYPIYFPVQLISAFLFYLKEIKASIDGPQFIVVQFMIFQLYDGTKVILSQCNCTLNFEF